MGLFERYLTVWVGIGMLAGVGLGLLVWGLPGHCRAGGGPCEPGGGRFHLGDGYPMMIQIDWSAVKDVGKKPRGLLLTLVVNWLIKPFTMAALGVLFSGTCLRPGLTRSRPANTSPA